MAISAKDVMELRKQTDCGMMECKKALSQADGDFDKAIEILREEGLATAAKKAGRIAAEGMVYAVSFDNCAVVVEVNAETDFVAKNDKFVEFTKNLANVVAEQKPADVEALMGCKMGEGTVDEALKALILVIKENIKVRRFARYEGHCAAYVHGGGTHGVIVKFETSDEVAAKPEFAAFGKDIAMQIAAANPSYLNESDVPADVLAKEKEIVLAQMANDPKTANKPDAIKEKMATGRWASSTRRTAWSIRLSSRTAASTSRSTLLIPLRLWAARSPSLLTLTSPRVRVWRSATRTSLLKSLLPLRANLIFQS